MKDLADVLLERSSQYHARYNYIRQLALSGFQKYASMVGYLTDHGEHHSENLVANTNFLLPDVLKQEMGIEEIFILLCSIQFHDIGLLSEKVEGEDWKSIRKDHVNRTYDYIHEYYQSWGLNRFEAYCIKNVCLGHSGDTLFDLPEEMVLHNTKIRIQFLASLLRMADELDLDYTRISPFVSQLKKIPEESKKHWLKHEEISGVLINSISWEIEVYAMPSSDEGKDVIKNLVEEKLQKELNYVHPIFTKNSLYYHAVKVIYKSFGEPRNDASPLHLNTQSGITTAQQKTNPALTYRNFDISVEGRDGSYSVQVLSSPAGEGKHSVLANINELEAIYHRFISRPSNHDLRDIGIYLFDFIFAGDVHKRFSESLGTIIGENIGIRIRLRLLPQELVILPWELMYDNERRLFLALSKNISIVRYLPVPEPIKPLKDIKPVRIAVVVTKPIDQSSLNSMGEMTAISDALAPLMEKNLVTITFIEKATKAKVREILFDQYHVFYFIGHGAFENEKGYLVFEDEKGYTDLIDAETLSLLLRNTSIRLALLNSCEGAKASRNDIFLGIAHSLVNAGIPAVIAMQLPILDKSAVVFAKEFFHRFIESKTLDECIASSREVLALNDGIDQPNWVSPVLFMRTEDGNVL